VCGFAAVRACPATRLRKKLPATERGSSVGSSSAGGQLHLAERLADQGERGGEADVVPHGDLRQLLQERPELQLLHRDVAVLGDESGELGLERRRVEAGRGRLSSNGGQNRRSDGLKGQRTGIRGSPDVGEGGSCDTPPAP